jgi:hypothetical protein
MAYQQYTLAQLQTLLEDKWEHKPYWVTEEATLALNEGLQTWNLLTGRWKRRVILETAVAPAYAWDYGLPDAITYRTRVTFNGAPLTPSAIGDLNMGRPSWQTETTLTGGDVPDRPTVWVPVSLQLIYIWPADGVGHNALTIDGVADTPVLVNPGDYVDLGEDDLSVLLGFALHVASFKKGGPWFAATFPYYQAFLKAAAAENQIITTALFYRRAMGTAMRDLTPIQSPSVPVSADFAQGTGGGR